MKRIGIIMSVLALCGGTAFSQSQLDAFKYSQTELNGTARYLGMGGAFGALGGDISTIGTNPAGIGIYRSNDIVASFGYSITDVESKYGGQTFNMGKNRWNFDNAGVVFSTKVGNVTSLRYVNFAFNYQRVKSFNRNMTMAGDLNVIRRPIRWQLCPMGLHRKCGRVVILLMQMISDGFPHWDGRDT